jgi:hypothetical protein
MWKLVFRAQKLEKGGFLQMSHMVIKNPLISKWGDLPNWFLSKVRAKPPQFLGTFFLKTVFWL